jgi:hypothetical protein
MQDRGQAVQPIETLPIQAGGLRQGSDTAMGFCHIAKRQREHMRYGNGAGKSRPACAGAVHHRGLREMNLAARLQLRSTRVICGLLPVRSVHGRPRRD